MANNEIVNQLIKNMSGQASFLTVNKSYIDFMGSIEGAVILSEMIFYSDRSSRKDGFFWKSYKEWYEETRVSEYNIKKYVSKMKDMGFLETKTVKAQGAPTLHYKLDMNKFLECFIPILKNLTFDNENFKNGNLKISETLTTITTSITNNNNYVHQDERKSEIELKFKKFWDTYNKKLGKTKALKAFEKVIKKHTIEEVIEHTLSYMDYLQAKDGNFKFQKHPTTFLNEFNLDDDYKTLAKQKKSVTVKKQDSFDSIFG